MRLALLSDIHGNPIALDAVLADISAQGEVDAYWVLGDMVALGFDPAGVLARLAQLPAAQYVRGNTEHYLVADDAIQAMVDQAQAKGRLERMLPILRTLAWTQGAVTSAGRLDWVAALPVELRLVLPDGTRLLGVHAAPGQFDGDGIHPGLARDELDALLAGCNADLVCVGHTHWPMDVRAGDVRVANLGSVSNPMAPDLRASYVLLDADAAGYTLVHRRVDYDHAAVIAAIDRARLPAADYIRSFQLGQREPDWKQS